MTLNNLFQELPERIKNDIRGRTFSKEQPTTIGAVFEIVLHASLVRARIEIDAAPCIAGSSRPDFVIGSATGETAFIEVTAVEIEPTLNRAQDDLYFLLEDTGRRVTVPGYLIDVVDFRPGEKTPSARSFARHLDTHFASLNRAEVLAQQGPEVVERNPIRYDDAASGWSVEYHIIATDTPTERSERIAASYTGGPARSVPYRGRTLKKIERKLSQHRDYLEQSNSRVFIAVTACDPGTELRDTTILMTLAGSPAVKFHEDGSSTQAFHLQDGIWSRGSVSANDSIWGVIAATHVDPCQLEQFDLCLYENPHLPASPLAQQWPFGRVCWPLPARAICRHKGRKAAELLHPDRPPS